MNILFVHEVDYLRKVIFEIHNWAELMSGSGHNVSVIDFEDQWNKSESYNHGSLRTNIFHNIDRTSSHSPITLIRPGFIKAPLLDRASAFLTHYPVIDWCVRKRHIDVIVLYSVPTNGFQAVKIAKKHKIPIVFRSIDIVHMLVPNRVLRPLAFSLEKWVYRNVDKILTLSPKLSEYAIRMGADKRKVELLPFGVNMNIFNPRIDAKRLREKLGITKDNKVILFIGTLFEFSGLDQYLEQFTRVVKGIPTAKLIIVGGGALSEKLRRIVEDSALTNNVILTGFQPYDMMPQYINLADICVNPFVINATTREIIPGKIIQYLACAKPVLATPLPGMISLLSGSKQGVVYSQIEDFAQTTIRLLKHPEQTEEIGENGYQYVRNNHDERKIANRLNMILNEAFLGQPQKVAH